MMGDHKLKGVLGVRDKSSTHGLSRSLAIEEKRIVYLEILAQHLQQCLRLYEDHMSTENLMEGIGKYKIKEEKYEFYEESLQLSQLQGFLGKKKAKGMYAQDCDYHGRYDCYYQNEDYYKRHGNYDEGLRFNPKINLPEFDGRMDLNEFLDWLNMVEHVFEYYDLPEREKMKLVAIKMCKNASIWWKNLKRQRERDGKKKIGTWEKMKKELKRRYLPTNYHQDIYLKFHNFKQ